MKKNIKVISLVISCVFLFSLLVAGCTNRDAKNGGASSQDGTGQIIESPVNLEMFLVTTLQVRDLEFQNNPYTKYLNDYANVKLKLTVPLPAERETQFNLILSSGNLPDIITQYGYEQLNAVGTDGGLLALDPYINKSQIMKDFHTTELWEKQKNENQNIYVIRSNIKETINPIVLIARMDLLEDVYGGKTPSNLDEWVEAATALKNKYPESTPFSSFGINYLDFFMRSFGVGGSQYKNINGKIIHVFEHPKMIDCINFYRMLYDEGLLDSTFATNDVQDWIDRYDNRKLLVYTGGGTSSWSQNTVPIEQGKPDWFEAVPYPVADGVDPAQVYDFLGRLGGGCIAINAQTKYPDNATKVVEAMLNREFMVFTAWGEDGVEYAMSDGKRIVNPQAANNSYLLRAVYRHMWDSHTLDALDAFFLAGIGAIEDEETRSKLAKTQAANKEIALRESKIAGYDPFEFYIMPSDVSLRSASEREEYASIILSIISNRITMEEYEIQAKAHVEKYSFVKENMQTWYDNNK